MEYLLYLAGLIIGVALFLYGLSLYEDSKRRIKAMRSGEKPGEKGIDRPVNPQEIAFSGMRRAPGERMCPICGTVLTRYEALYASQQENGAGKKILIHGCRYCYKPDEKADEEKKSDY